MFVLMAESAAHAQLQPPVVELPCKYILAQQQHMVATPTPRTCLCLSAVHLQGC